MATFVAEANDAFPLVIFGGTFDPVHRAHISCARTVSKTLGNCPVRLMPNAAPPHRAQPMADGQQRMAMLKLACEPWPLLQPDDFELRQTGPSWTLNTLQHFRQQIGRRPMIFVLGSDSLATLDQWHQWQHFPELCHLLTVPRPGHFTVPDQILAAFTRASASALCQQSAGCLHQLEGPLLDVSSSAVRKALMTKGRCPAISAPVMDYIRHHHLYNVKN